MHHRRLSRRQVLQLGAITGLAVACTPTATPAPTAQAVLPTLTPLPIQPTATNTLLAVNTAAPTGVATATPAAELALIQAMTVAAQKLPQSIG